MSAPPEKTSALLRWLSVLMVVAAIVVRFRTGGAPVVNNSAPPAGSGAVASSSSSAPSQSRPGRGGGAREFGEGVGFRSHERLVEHFRKHGREFHAATPEDYLRMAQALRDRPAGGNVLELLRGDGVTCRFDRASRAFLAFGADGVIRTFFRPNDGERYFQRQASRPDGSP